jgi:hypothetical protein
VLRQTTERQVERLEKCGPEKEFRKLSEVHDEIQNSAKGLSYFPSRANNLHSSTINTIYDNTY